jgi:hypothetical protein
VKDYFNINEAAKATGKSIPTIRAKLDQGLLPNAHQVTEGKTKRWRIPLSDLIASGLLDSSAPSSEAGQSRTEALESEIDRLSSELVSTKEQLRRADEVIAELRKDKALLNEEKNKLFSQLFPPAIETRATQERRRFSWFTKNP